MPATAGNGFDKASCTFHGKKLYGAIREVSGIADVTVRVVDGISDLSVRKVTGIASSCGEWKWSTASPIPRSSSSAGSQM